MHCQTIIYSVRFVMNPANHLGIIFLAWNQLFDMYLAISNIIA